jgi:putative FmdB family regulatory protein
MPRYDFTCPQCNLTFEVSRPLSRASEPASCPNDGTEAVRVFTMPMSFVQGGTVGASDPPPAPPSGGHSHGHGHSHGPGGHVH